MLHRSSSINVILVKLKGCNGYNGYPGKSQGLGGGTRRDTYSNYRSDGLVLRSYVASAAAARSGSGSCGNNCSRSRCCRALECARGPCRGGIRGSTLTEYFSILATGEALFVTFYSHAIANYQQLGIHGNALIALEAIRAEEQLHLNFAKANGGVPATTHFSMPHGAATFQDRALFLATQQLGEDLTNGALLAWIKDMATMGRPRLAEVSGQLMQVEGGHRVVGRVIMNAEPWDNWGFGPVVLESFLQVPAAVKAAGFLSPRRGNDFEFHPVSPSYPGVIHTKP